MAIKMVRENADRRASIAARSSVVGLIRRWAGRALETTSRMSPRVLIEEPVRQLDITLSDFMNVVVHERPVQPRPKRRASLSA